MAQLVDLQASATDQWAPLLAARTRLGRSDAIRDILAAAATPGVLSLAGGIPAPESFPVAPLGRALDTVMSGYPTQALQYAPTEGVERMRAVLATMATATGAAVGTSQVLVTSGSQQGLDLTAQALLEEGDLVALDDPSYLGAVQVFRRAGARLLAVPGDSDGMRTDVLEQRLAAGARCKLVYVVPHFHNPTGAVLSAERRAHLARLADRYGFLIIEDDPYADLAFDGSRLPSTDVHTDRVIRLMSLSKTLCPGLRVAGLVAPEQLVRDLAGLKQGSDLQTNTLSQYVLAELLQDPGFLPGHVSRLQALYRGKATWLTRLLRERLPWLSFQEPRGGLFLWCTLADPRLTADRLYPRALAEGVAFVPGTPFCIDQDGSALMRISYAALDHTQQEVAVDRLARAFAAETEKARTP
ncbi:2-aminoadipate transaminase [Streptacidiphilus sp. MAP12-20]|uniref:aminotransferase-like domain-containing protein n=1 Tax=Streptacidiphilus sp. MAP12-20 TaxID=3156299 RepID=UPI003519D58A